MLVVINSVKKCTEEKDMNFRRALRRDGYGWEYFLGHLTIREENDNIKYKTTKIFSKTENNRTVQQRV